MKYKWAVFGRLNEYLFDIFAETKEEALAKAKLESAYANQVILVVPGNDLGVNGIS